MPRALAHLVSFLVLTVGLVVFPRAAGAQELVGSAAATTAVHLPQVTLRAPAFAVCAPDGGDCRDLHPYAIHMEVFPHWDFRVPLPDGFMLTNHNWTMEHDSIHLSVRQAIIGGTLRHQRGDWWIEAGAAGAEASISHPDATDEMAGNDVGRIGMAVLGGMGGWVHLGDHVELDLRLRAGMGVGDAASGIYRAQLAIAFAWK